MQKDNKNRKLKNGLTEDQVHGARAILKQVNISAICEKQGVKITTIYNVLRDESPKVEDLRKVLVAANREVKKKVKTLKALPV